VLPYIAAQLLVGLAVGLVILVPFAIAAATGLVLAATLVGVVAVVAILYLYTKFSLTVPVIVIEDVKNPLHALGRSWSLTKGNSVRLFLFYVLIFVAFIVVAMVLGIVGGVLGLIAGTEAGILVNALMSAATSMVGITLYLAVLAAVHRQLSGGAKEVGATFE
jgi:membrane-anchored glycerophosphoryl diester phosphodiesterase (GDPDase)